MPTLGDEARCLIGSFAVWIKCRQLGEETAHRAFWPARSDNVNVWTTKKRVEKLKYMHRNPVKRRLLESPKQWRSSSYRFTCSTNLDRYR